MNNALTKNALTKNALAKNTGTQDTVGRDTTSTHRRTEAGMTTAEYTVGTLGACSVAAVLIKIAQTEWFGDLVKGLLENIVGIAGF